MIKLSTGTTDGLQKITPEQKIGLAAQWNTIASEYPPIIEQAVLSGVKTTAEYRAYEASYGALDAYLHNADSGMLAHMDALSFVEPAEYQKVWNTYYNDKAKLLLLVAIPPTNQVADITLSAIPQADKTINVTVACKYTQGFFKATHIVLYRTSATSAPRPIDTASAHAHVIPLLPGAPDNHEYSVVVNLPQISGNVQLHYRFAITAAFLGAGALALHKDGVIDGGADWHDVTVEQLMAGSLYNYWNYDTGELRAGKKDNYIRLNPETNELEHKGIEIKMPDLEQHIAEVENKIQEKIDKALIAILTNGYVQWPGMPSPLEDTNLHFAGYSWYEVNYDGNFFRAKGRNAQAFSAKNLTIEQIRNGDYIFQDDEQGDAIRNIRGGINSGYNSVYMGDSPYPDNVFRPLGGDNLYGTTSGAGGRGFLFDASFVVPTAEENRPRNLTFTIWALVKDE